MNDLANKNLNSVDFMKLIMSFMVVAIHVNLMKSTYFTPTVSKWIETIVNIAVPFFFVASGYLFSRKLFNVDGTQKDDCFENIKKYLTHIIKLYFYWTMLYIPLTISGFIIGDKSILFSIGLFIRGVFFVGENFYSWPLWYLLALIVSVLVIQILLHLKCKVLTIVLISILFFLIGRTYDALYTTEYLSPILTKIMYAYKVVFGTTRNGLFTGLAYVSIGLFIARYGVLKSNLILVLLLVLSFIGFYFNITICGLILAYSLFSLSLKWEMSGNVEFYKKCRSLSTLIYFIHMYFIAFYRFTIFEKGTKGVFLFVIALFSTFFFSLILLKIRSHNKLIRLDKLM